MSTNSISRFLQSGTESPLDRVNERLAALEASQTNLALRVDGFALAIERAMRASLRMARSAQTLRTLRFDARMPNTVFSHVGLPERDAAGEYLRWVTRTHVMKGEFELPRGTQYLLEVTVAAFPSIATQESFYVRADGLSLPWMSVNGRVFTTLLPLAAKDSIALEICVSPHAAAEAGGLAFAFSSILLTAQ